MEKLTVDFIEYFSAATYRHLSMHFNEKIKVYMLPSEDGVFAINKMEKEEAKNIDFQIKTIGKVFRFKILVSHNSKCISLLSSEFINGLIWAIDPSQDFTELDYLAVSKESISHVLNLEIDGYSDEFLILNVIDM